MGTAINMTEFDAYLKETYLDEKYLYQMDEYGNELLKLVPKKTDASGDTWTVPIGQSSPVGDSATYASSLAAYSAGADKKFYGTWKDRFAMIALQDKVLTMSRDKKGAVTSAVNKMEQLRKQFLESTNLQLFGDAGGAIARLGTDTILTDSLATGSLDSATKYRAQFIKEDMALVVGPNKDGSSLRSSTPVYVTSVDARNGKFTIDAAQGGGTAGGGDWPASTANTDYVFKYGDAAASLLGLEAWIPTSDPTVGAEFKGVVRSNDFRALSGIRIDASAKTVEEGLIDAVWEVRQYGSTADAIVVHPKRAGQLIKELAGRSSYERVSKVGVDLATGKKGTKAMVGYKAIVIETEAGPLTIVTDSACQYQYGWVLDTKTLCFETAEAWPHVRDKDGLKMLRQANENYIFELLGYGEFLCYAPGKNANVNFGV